MKPKVNKLLFFLIVLNMNAFPELVSSISHQGNKYFPFLHYYIQIQIENVYSAQAETFSMPKNLQQLKEIKNQNYQQLSRSEQQVKELVSVPLKTSTSLNQLSLEQKELRARMDFYDRLNLQLEIKADQMKTASQFRTSLIDIIAKLINIESQYSDDHSSISSSNSSSLFSFLNYLHLALQTIPEPNENLINFIEDYIKFSSITNPQKPDKFSIKRNYTNGKVSSTAHPTEASEVGLALEPQILKLETILEKKNN